MDQDGQLAGELRPGLTALLFRMEFLQDLWAFLKQRKQYWLAPLIIILLILGVLIVLGGSSALAPFVYTMF